MSHLLCPVRALACYVSRTAAMRRSQRLFVHYREQSQGLPLSAQRLSHWLCEAVSQAYLSSGAEPRGGHQSALHQRNFILHGSARRNDSRRHLYCSFMVFSLLFHPFLFTGCFQFFSDSLCAERAVRVMDIKAVHFLSHAG